MYLEQGVYGKSGMICRKNFDYIKGIDKTRVLPFKYKLQEQNIGFILIMSGRKTFHDTWTIFLWKVYETKFRGEETHDYQKFGELICSAVMNKTVRFRKVAQLIKYQQKRYNSCCLSSLAFASQYIDDNRDVTDLVNRIEESLTLQTEIFKKWIHFTDTIMKTRKRLKRGTETTI